MEGEEIQTSHELFYIIFQNIEDGKEHEAVKTVFVLSQYSVFPISVYLHCFPLWKNNQYVNQ